MNRNNENQQKKGNQQQHTKQGHVANLMSCPAKSEGQEKKGRFSNSVASKAVFTLETCVIKNLKNFHHKLQI